MQNQHIVFNPYRARIERRYTIFLLVFIAWCSGLIISDPTSETAFYTYLLQACKLGTGGMAIYCAMISSHLLLLLDPNYPDSVERAIVYVEKKYRSFFSIHERPGVILFFGIIGLIAFIGLRDMVILFHIGAFLLVFVIACVIQYINLILDRQELNKLNQEINILKRNSLHPAEGI